MNGLSATLVRTVLALGLAFALGWALSPAPAPPADLVQARRADWSLPALPVRLDSAALVGRVTAAPFWGGRESPPAAAAPAADARWRVAAIFGNGDARRLRVEFFDASKPPLTLKVGDALPSGHRVTEIGERNYCVQIGGRAYVMGVERVETR